ncbi:MAG: cyclic nucleotide-binding domain-containing protein [Oscillospiraceae bacterium]|nr:cyclic nucleotide-binding domain-containing protein [Oscillospiraceae bacterium]
MNTLTFNRNEVIFKQGSFSDCMYDIVEGRVGIYTDYGTEKQQFLADLDNNQVVGEMSMLEYYPRSATAVALEDGTVLTEITEDELSDYFRNKPEKLLLIMKQLSRRIRETNEKYIEACRAVYEKNEAERNNREQSEWLNSQIDTMCEIYGNYFYY